MKTSTALAVGLGTLYLGVAAAVTAVSPIVFASWNALERAVGAQKQTNTLRLVEKGVQPIYTHGGVCFGKFVNPKGDTLTFYDMPDILSGKPFPNTVIPNAQEGENYEVTSLQGPISSKLLKLN